MHPLIQVQAGNGESMPFWTAVPWLIVVLAVIEFAFLYRVLTRDDFDALNKILWVIVLIGVPFFGFVLYLLAAPASTAPRRTNRAKYGDNLSGTPWVDDPGHTRESR